jgi:hypothetical protein
MAKIREELSEAAHAAELKALDRNKDGVVDRKDATQMAQMVEERFPLGIIIVVCVSSFVLGCWVRGFFL